MKKHLSTTLGVVSIALLYLLNSCGKGFPEGRFINPLTEGCQVAEYHIPEYDQFFNYKLPYLFRKTFDPSGKILKEMACGFSNDNQPLSVPNFLLDVTITQKDRRVFLIKADSGKVVVPDTLATIYLNGEGRPDSCIGRPGSDPEVGPTGFELEYYYYKDSRVTYIKHNTLHEGADGFVFSVTDTVRYDKYGNPVSYGFNTYTYDYTHKGGQKFYADAFMGNESNFYLLQYLGFFPEINNPPNIRTFEHNSDASEGGPMTNQQFDAQGKLTSFELSGEKISITWSCSR